jgi:hypothetical protein
MRKQKLIKGLGVNNIQTTSRSGLIFFYGPQIATAVLHVRLTASTLHLLTTVTTTVLTYLSNTGYPKKMYTHYNTEY